MPYWTNISNVQSVSIASQNLKISAKVQNICKCVNIQKKCFMFKHIKVLPIINLDHPNPLLKSLSCYLFTMSIRFTSTK